MQLFLAWVLLYQFDWPWYWYLIAFAVMVLQGVADEKFHMWLRQGRFDKS